MPLIVDRGPDILVALLASQAVICRVRRSQAAETRTWTLQRICRKPATASAIPCLPTSVASSVRTSIWPLSGPVSRIRSGGDSRITEAEANTALAGAGGAKQSAAQEQASENVNVGKEFLAENGTRERGGHPSVRSPVRDPDRCGRPEADAHGSGHHPLSRDTHRWDPVRLILRSGSTGHFPFNGVIRAGRKRFS